MKVGTKIILIVFMLVLNLFNPNIKKTYSQIRQINPNQLNYTIDEMTNNIINRYDNIDYDLLENNFSFSAERRVEANKNYNIDFLTTEKKEYLESSEVILDADGNYEVTLTYTDISEKEKFEIYYSGIIFYNEIIDDYMILNDQSGSFYSFKEYLEVDLIQEDVMSDKGVLDCGRGVELGCSAGGGGGGAIIVAIIILGAKLVKISVAYIAEVAKNIANFVKACFNAITNIWDNVFGNKKDDEVLVNAISIDGVNHYLAALSKSAFITFKNSMNINNYYLTMLDRGPTEENIFYMSKNPVSRDISKEILKKNIEVPVISGKSTFALSIYTISEENAKSIAIQAMNENGMYGEVQHDYINKGSATFFSHYHPVDVNTYLANEYFRYSHSFYGDPLAYAA